jgi:hypothetical protein
MEAGPKPPTHHGDVTGDVGCSLPSVWPFAPFLTELRGRRSVSETSPVSPGRGEHRRGFRDVTRRLARGLHNRLRRVSRKQETHGISRRRYKQPATTAPLPIKTPVGNCAISERRHNPSTAYRLG